MSSALQPTEVEITNTSFRSRLIRYRESLQAGRLTAADTLVRIFWPAPTSKNHHIIPYPQAPNQSNACNIRVWPGETRCRIQEEDTPCGWIAANEDALREHILKTHLLENVRRRKRGCKGLRLMEKTGGPTAKSVLELIGLLLGQHVIQSDQDDKNKDKAATKEQVEAPSPEHFQKEGTDSEPVVRRRTRRKSTHKTPVHEQLNPSSGKEDALKFDNTASLGHHKSATSRETRHDGSNRRSLLTRNASSVKRALPRELGTATPLSKNESNTKSIRKTSTPNEKRRRTGNRVQFKDCVSTKPTTTPSASPNSSFEVVIYSKARDFDNGNSNKPKIMPSHSCLKDAKEKKFDISKRKPSRKTMEERVA